MGYLINSSDIIITKITIPEADVLTLNTIPYNLIIGSGASEYILVKYAAIYPAINQTIAYSGYGSIYLTGESSGPIFATCNELIGGGGISSIYLQLFNINSIQPPINIGAFIKIGNGVDIQFRNAVTSGDGDVIVYLEYQYLTI
jgi:hypothetical protein